MITQCVRGTVQCPCPCFPICQCADRESSALPLPTQAGWSSSNSNWISFRAAGNRIAFKTAFPLESGYGHNSSGEEGIPLLPLWTKCKCRQLMGHLPILQHQQVATPDTQHQKQRSQSERQNGKTYILKLSHYITSTCTDNHGCTGRMEQLNIFQINGLSKYA